MTEIPYVANIFIETRNVMINYIMDDILKLNDIQKDYYMNSFEFKSEKTFLGSIKNPLMTVLLYCICIPLLQYFMKNKKSANIKYILIVHNLFLSLISAFVAFVLIATILEFRYVNGYKIFRLYCGLNIYDQNGLLTLIYYINYLLKYYELLDTIFLCLKKRKISFLHGYHHPATLVLTWGQLIDSTGLQWIVILLNLFVHTVMYFYYFLASLKIKFPFPQLITLMQIMQFIIDIFVCYNAMFQYLTHNHCYGKPRSAYGGALIITSYLYLFVDFFQERYCQRKRYKHLSNKIHDKDMIHKKFD